MLFKPHQFSERADRNIDVSGLSAFVVKVFLNLRQVDLRIHVLGDGQLDELQSPPRPGHYLLDVVVNGSGR